MVVYRNVVIARPVRLKHGGRWEVKDWEALVDAATRKPVVPVYYGVKHEEVDRAPRDFHVANAKLHPDFKNRVLLADIDYFHVPNALDGARKIGYSLWYTVGSERVEAGDVLTGDFDFKHLLATLNPADDLTGVQLRGEERVESVSPSVSATVEENKNVKRQGESMSEQEPKPKETATEPVEAPKTPAPTTQPEAPQTQRVDETAEERRAFLQYLREKHASRFPEAFLKSQNLKQMIILDKHYTKELENQTTQSTKSVSNETGGAPARPTAGAPGSSNLPPGYEVTEENTLWREIQKTDYPEWARSKFEKKWGGYPKGAGVKAKDKRV